MDGNENYGTQNEEQSQQEERRFTQAEVEEMIKSRLARERKKTSRETDSTQEDGRESTLAQRELTVTAKERLQEAGLPSSLANVLRYTDEKTLDTAIEAIKNLKHGAPGTWGQRQVSDGKPDAIRKAMGLDRK